MGEGETPPPPPCIKLIFICSKQTAQLGKGGEVRGAKVLHTYIHTDPPTKWVLEELSLLKIRNPPHQNNTIVKVS